MRKMWNCVLAGGARLVVLFTACWLGTVVGFAQGNGAISGTVADIGAQREIDKVGHLR